MRKLYPLSVITAILSLFIHNSFGQPWTVGYPVQVTLTSVGGFTGGCSPNADFTFSFPGSAVTGVSYYLIVTATPQPNQVYLTPGNDTLAVGDSIFMAPGTNSYGVYCFSGSGGSVSFDIVAAGIPTTAGEAYPCSVPLWLSNLLLCPEGLINGVSNNCQVQSSTGISENNSLQPDIIYPSHLNGNQLQVKGACDNVQLSDITGKILVQQSGTDVSFNLNGYCSGIYIVTVASGTGTTSIKFDLK
ncbi:MAG TPA: T9SS type A sorting domain-containing protein [Bacteroidia bacterium]|nr:T9SS type A sorting domain-containing protein [Bacteroidia bacterium]